MPGGTLTSSSSAFRNRSLLYVFSEPVVSSFYSFASLFFLDFYIVFTLPRALFFFRLLKSNLLIYLLSPLTSFIQLGRCWSFLGLGFFRLDGCFLNFISNGIDV